MYVQIKALSENAKAEINPHKLIIDETKNKIILKDLSKTVQVNLELFMHNLYDFIFTQN